MVEERRRKSACRWLQAILAATLMLTPVGLTGSQNGSAPSDGQAAVRAQPEPPVLWVQDSSEDFNGSGYNLSQPIDLVIGDNGLILADDVLNISQTDWSGGPKVIYQVAGGKCFYNSSNIKWTTPGNISLNYNASWTSKAPMFQDRGSCRAVWDPKDDQMIVFGGFAWIGGVRTLLNHTEYYNATTDTWGKGTSTPPGRQSPGLAWDSKRGQMFLFGGGSDAWYFTPGKGSGGCWTQMKSCAEGMSDGNVVYDPNTDLLVAHGRSYMQVSLYNPNTDSWKEGSEEYHIRDGAGGAWLPNERLFLIVNGDDYANKPETGFYAPGNDTWLYGPDYPPWRRYCTLVWDDYHNIAILYAGTKDGGFVGACNEIWFYDPLGNNWTMLENADGPKLYAHGAAWDPVNHQMLVVGGITSAGALSRSVDAMTLSYAPSAWLESSTLDTGGIASLRGVYWEMDSSPPEVGPSPVKLQLASSTSPAPTKYVGPDDSTGSYYVTSGPSLSGSHTGNRYMRYRLSMSSADMNATPVLGHIRIEYSSYRPTGSFRSSVFDTGLNSPKGVAVSWEAETPQGTSLAMYIRSSADAGMSTPTDWMQIQNGQNLSGVELKRYIQYKVEMRSPSRGFTPRLWKVSFGFNGAPSLALASHAPLVGNLSTVFTFYVSYTDQDGMAPANYDLILDGEKFTMAPQDVGSVQEGKRYEYSSMLAMGAHTYAFLFNDGFGDMRLPATGTFKGPTVNAEPSLSQGKVDPPEGNTSTVFNFTVRYSDPERAAAAMAILLIDGAQNLTMVDRGAQGQNYSIYEQATTLPAGTHRYCFIFSDGQTEVRLPPVGEFSGPEVQPPPVPPGLLEVFPPDGALDVNISTTVEAIFDHTMDANSFSSTNFSLKDARSRPIDGRISFEAAGTKAVFTPYANLSWNETFTAHITTGVRDQNGSALQSDHGWSFTTVPAPPIPPGSINHPPIVPLHFERTLTEGQELVLDLEAVDPDGDALNYTVISGPNGAQVNGSGILTWRTAQGDRGQHKIVVKVSDGMASNVTIINVTVEQATGGNGGIAGGTSFFPMVIIVIVVVAIALAVALFLLRRRKGPAVPAGPDPGTAPPPPPPPNQVQYP